MEKSCCEMESDDLKKEVNSVEEGNVRSPENTDSDAGATDSVDMATTGVGSDSNESTTGSALEKHGTMCRKGGSEKGEGGKIVSSKNNIDHSKVENDHCKVDQGLVNFKDVGIIDKCSQFARVEVTRIDIRKIQREDGLSSKSACKPNIVISTGECYEKLTPIPDTVVASKKQKLESVVNGINSQKVGSAWYIFAC